MTKPIVSEQIKRISELLVEVCLKNDDLLMDANKALLNGDSSAARLVISELRNRNLKQWSIHELILQGNLTDAEADAQRLAQSSQNGVNP